MNQNGICLPHKVSTVKSAKVSDHHKILNSHVSVVCKLLCDCALLKGELRRFLSVFCALPDMFQSYIYVSMIYWAILKGELRRGDFLPVLRALPDFVRCSDMVRCPSTANVVGVTSHKEIVLS